MLTQINIRNFATVEALELDFSEGMTVLTGETGAGKSILVDALALILGGRADNKVVRDSSERCEMSAAFTLAPTSPSLAWLSEHDLDAGSDCQIRRVIRKDGRSKAYINGTPATAGSLSELGNMLVEIHGQHEQYGLLSEAVQRQLLDGFGGHIEIVDRVRRCWHEWRSALRQYEEMRSLDSDSPEHRQLLAYQLEELDDLALGEQELESLESEHQRLLHTEDLLQLADNAVNQLYGDDDTTIQSQLGQMLRALQDKTHIDSRLEDVLQTMQQASYLLGETSSALTQYRDHLESDPQRLAQLEERLGKIYDLARKHQVPATELPRRHSELQKALQQMASDREQRSALVEKIDGLQARYRKQVQQLGGARQRAAKPFSHRTLELIASLGMPNARFEVDIVPTEPGAHGGETIRFLVSLNPGQDLRPLKQVASGGELSRISLAIQVATQRLSGKPTLVFDEVDSGIGGATAEIVGQQLRALSESAQVLCVTHLPQVAARASHHVKVSKRVRDNATHTAVRQLDASERVSELARMLGGIKITEQTRAHAEEMLSGTH